MCVPEVLFAQPQRLANTAHIRQSTPDTGLAFKVKSLKRFKVLTLRLEADLKIGEHLDHMSPRTLVYEDNKTEREAT